MVHNAAIKQHWLRMHRACASTGLATASTLTGLQDLPTRAVKSRCIHCRKSKAAEQHDGCPLDGHACFVSRPAKSAATLNAAYSRRALLQISSVLLGQAKGCWTMPGSPPLGRQSRMTTRLASQSTTILFEADAELSCTLSLVF